MFTCILAVVIENKVPTKGEAVSLGVLTLGVMVAVWEGTVTGSPRAIMLCLGGTLSNAAMMSTSGKVLSEKVDVLRLTFYTAPISLLALIPALYLREVCPCRIISYKLWSGEMEFWGLGCLHCWHSREEVEGLLLAQCRRGEGEFCSVEL